MAVTLSFYNLIFVSHLEIRSSRGDPIVSTAHATNINPTSIIATFILSKFNTLRLKA